MNEQLNLRLRMIAAAALALLALLLRWLGGSWFLATTFCIISIGLQPRCREYFRSTRLSNWLRENVYRMRVEFAGERRVFDRPVIFALEPHGYQCTAIMLLFCGYGTHGNALLDRYGAVFMEKTRVVATQVAFLMPLVGNVFSLFGAIENERSLMEAQMRCGRNLVVVPSGLLGKQDAVRPRRADRVHVVMRPNNRFGFAKLAVDRGAYLTPVLVPDEASVYQPLFGVNWWPLPWWLVPMRESWLLGGVRRPMRVLVGEPIDASKYAGRVSELARDYYAALQEMGKVHGLEVVLH